MTKGILAAKAHGLGKDAGTSPQGGSMILEAVIVLGMIATFTPLLYKHVADRRADIENINRANTLLYLQQKTEKYLKDPANIKALVDELGHNQHKEIYPSELGIDTTNFDGRYIIGIRREDEENKPVLKAMIIDTVNTGSDLRAARVAELIGVSAGIYTAVDPDAAWGINGLWSEPLERYFNTTNIPTGAVAVTTEYNKKKYRVNISDILVDKDLDLGEFDLTAEQINAINLAAQKGTIDQLIATTKVSSPKVVAETKLCLGSEDDENCIESWKGLGEDGQDSSDLILIQMCNSGLTEPCTLAFARDLNTSCSKVDAVYDRFRVAYPNPKVYTLTYGSGGTYGGEIRVRCGTSFMVDNISSSTLANPVEQVGGSALAVTQPGWYQITLMGEAGVHSSGVAYDAAGGILFASKYYSEGDILTLKGIKGWVYSGAWWGGAGMALWDTMDTTGAPTLVAGGGAAGVMAGGGYDGGTTNWSSGGGNGYGWDDSRGGNTTYCDGTNNCDVASGGMAFYSSYTPYGGSGRCGGGYNCTQIAGGNSKNKIEGYSAEIYGNGNWVTDELTGGKGYASIAYCGASQSDCPTPCITNRDCPSDIPFCDNGACYATCVANSQCSDSTPFCVNGSCETRSCSSNADCGEFFCISGSCVKCAAPAPGSVVRYSSSGTYTVVCPGKYQLSARGGNGTYSTNAWWHSSYSTGSGGYVSTSGYFEAGDVLKITSTAVRRTSCDDGEGRGESIQSAAGVGISNNDNYIIVAGGGGISFSSSGCGIRVSWGGGGWIGGGDGCWSNTQGQNAGMHPKGKGCPGGGGAGLSGYSSSGPNAYTLGNSRGGAGGTAEWGGPSLSEILGSATSGTAGTPYGGTGSGPTHTNIKFSTGHIMTFWMAGAGGGSGYCAPGYTCAADAKGAGAGTGRIVYCGSYVDSECP